MTSFKETYQELLSLVDVKVNGDRPWDVRVHNKLVFQRIFAEGSVGLGEAYMDGWWDCERLDEFFYRILRGELEKKANDSFRVRCKAILAKILNFQSHRRSKEVVNRHYNMDNELYQHMLDKRMVYTCAYWKGAETLEEAQEKKMDLVCQKIGLQKGMTVLDLGCGWGSFAKYAAEKYGVDVVGVNRSEEQISLARELCRGLPVELRQQDYRKVEGKFDRVISIGIMEHVGPKNYPTYMDVVDRCLTQDGIAFIHTIGSNGSYFTSDAWFDKYIFPNGVAPSLAQLFRTMEERFIVEDVHNIGPHYDRTVMEWNRRFQEAWPVLKQDGKYDERFKRIWEYYLLCSAGMFRARKLQLWQIVMNRERRPQPPCRFL